VRPSMRYSQRNGWGEEPGGETKGSRNFRGGHRAGTSNDSSPRAVDHGGARSTPSCHGTAGAGFGPVVGPGTAGGGSEPSAGEQSSRAGVRADIFTRHGRAQAHNLPRTCTVFQFAGRPSGLVPLRDTPAVFKGRIVYGYERGAMHWAKTGREPRTHFRPFHGPAKQQTRAGAEKCLKKTQWRG